ncbi:cytochrome P450 [Xylariaceae sp. FL0016]|nr:cytochrome P450 [Xylariaceae sp. FL0016]
MAVQLTRETDMASIWMLVAVSGVLAYLGLAIYRLFFHPLAKIPGPRLAAATYWYEAYYELAHKGGAQFAPKVRGLHAKYGPIVRINPDEVSVNDAEFHDRLYAPQPAIRDRHPNFSAALGTTKGSFSTVDHNLHRSRRMAYSPFFASSNVTAFEPLAQDKVRHLCDLLQCSEERSPDMRSYFAALGFDSFYTWAFGSSLDLLDDLAMARQCNNTVELLVTSAPFYRIFPSVMGLARRVPQGILRHLSHHIARVFDLHAMIAQKAEQFVASNQCQSYENLEKETPSSRKSGPETLFSVISRSKAPEEEKTASRMSQEGTEMFMASFTPGRTMTLGMYYLQTNPDVLETLQKELDQVHPDRTTDLSFKTLNSLPYLRAVMKEILRLTFPVGSRLPMICHEDMEFQGWRIPKNTAISVNHRNLLWDPSVYREPEKFKPSRWLDETSPIDEKRYFVAFGKGGRGCPGREFATQLIQFTLATLIQRFDFQVADTTWERDIAVSRESILTAPAFGSKGVKLELLGARD